MKRKIIIFLSLIILIILSVFIVKIVLPKFSEESNIKRGYDLVVTETEINPGDSGYSYSSNPRYVYFDEKIIREYSIYGIIPEEKETITLINTYEITDDEIEILKSLINEFVNNEKRYSAENVGRFGTYYRISYNGKSYNAEDESLIEKIIYKK